jgi:hypothetical protein
MGGHIMSADDLKKLTTESLKEPRWPSYGSSEASGLSGGTSPATGLRSTRCTTPARKRTSPKRTRSTVLIRAFFDGPTAAACLKDIDKGSIRALIHIPPGDDRYQPGHSKFREKSQRRVRQFTTSKSAVDRLSALMRVVYQVRCNTIHGSKKPHVIRDQQLVEASTPIVKVVVRHLSAIMAQTP